MTSVGGGVFGVRRTGQSTKSVSRLVRIFAAITAVLSPGPLLLLDAAGSATADGTAERSRPSYTHVGCGPAVRTASNKGANAWRADRLHRAPRNDHAPLTAGDREAERHEHPEAERAAAIRCCPHLERFDY